MTSFPTRVGLVGSSSRTCYNFSSWAGSSRFRAMEKIVMKVPHVRPGRYNISIQAGNAIYIQPVRFTVQE